MRSFCHFNRLGCAASTYVRIKKSSFLNYSIFILSFQIFRWYPLYDMALLFCNLKTSPPSPLQFNSSTFESLSIRCPNVYVKTFFCLASQKLKLFKSSYFHLRCHQVYDRSKFMNLTGSACGMPRTVFLKHLTMSLIFLAFSVLVLVIPIFLLNYV